MKHTQSLKSLEDFISSLEKQYAGEVAIAADQSRQKATLQFLGGLKELVRAFCLHGCEPEDECGYIPFSLREK